MADQHEERAESKKRDRQKKEGRVPKEITMRRREYCCSCERDTKFQKGQVPTCQSCDHDRCLFCMKKQSTWRRATANEAVSGGDTS